MSRFGPDPQAFFDAVYQGAAPWEIGGVRPAMTALIERYPPQGPALDLGCASGDLVFHLARSDTTWWAWTSPNARSSRRTSSGPRFPRW